jgi:hypothetical protein
MRGLGLTGLPLADPAAFGTHLIAPSVADELRTATGASEERKDEREQARGADRGLYVGSSGCSVRARAGADGNGDPSHHSCGYHRDP